MGMASELMMATPRMSPGTPDAKLRVREYHTLEDASVLLPEWERLLALSASASIFSSWEWLSSWWNAFGQDGRGLILAFLDHDSTLVGCAPLYVTRIRVPAGPRLRLLRLLGDGSGDSDNLDIIIRPGFEMPVCNALVSYISRSNMEWDFCELNTLPATSPLAGQFCDVLRGKEWTLFRKSRDSSAVELPSSWEMFLSQISSKERTKLRYYLNRLNRKYSSLFYRCERQEEVLGCLENLFDLHQRRWKEQGKPGSFGCLERRKFYVEMACGLLERGRLEFYLLELNGKTVAADYNFRYGQTVFSLQSGFDPAFGSDRVAYLLKGHVLEQAIRSGATRYDFLGGLDENKLRWGAKPSTYIDIHFARPYSRGAAYLQLREFGSRSKEKMREKLPSGLWSSLRWLRKQVAPVVES
jgi:CelD/BcsL family acetyltransferase involved in cellulose biosynthesis